MILEQLSKISCPQDNRSQHLWQWGPPAQQIGRSQTTITQCDSEPKSSPSLQGLDDLLDLAPRPRRKNECGHGDRTHYSGGKCQTCYLAHYYVIRKNKKRLAKA